MQIPPSVPEEDSITGGNNGNVNPLRGSSRFTGAVPVFPQPPQGHIFPNQNEMHRGYPNHSSMLPLPGGRVSGGTQSPHGHNNNMHHGPPLTFGSPIPNSALNGVIQVRAYTDS
jgi:hypothetical protein